MTYITPADVPISATWQDHKNRNPPSKEPGTDFATPYGTNLRMPGNGVITIVDNDPSGAEGRRLEMLMDNGEIIDYIHLDSIQGTVGENFTKGQLGLCISGASGNGVNWFYGPHVHVTRRAHGGIPYADSIDFMLAVDATPAGGGGTPFTPTIPEEYMSYSIVPFANEPDIFVVSLVTGLYVKIENTYHLQLLQRLKKDNSDDPMLRTEVDICKSYLSAINPGTTADGVASALRANIANTPLVANSFEIK